MKFEAYKIPDRFDAPIIPATSKRDWMLNWGGSRVPTRCIPMMTANASGWFVLWPYPFQCIWNGGPNREDTKIEGLVTPICMAGHGVLTFNLPWIFRLPAGYSLLVRPVPNQPKPDVFTYDALIEYDKFCGNCAVTMKIMTPDKWIRFERNEPIALIIPQRRRVLEQFDPKMYDLSANPKVKQGSDAFQSRINGVLEKWFKTGPDNADLTNTYAKQADQTKVAVKAFRLA